MGRLSEERLPLVLPKAGMPSQALCDRVNTGVAEAMVQAASIHMHGRYTCMGAGLWCTTWTTVCRSSDEGNVLSVCCLIKCKALIIVLAFLKTGGVLDV